MFNLEITGNLKYYLQICRKRLKYDKCFEKRIPEKIILDEVTKESLEEIGIKEIKEPSMTLYLRPHIIDNIASISIGIHSDLWAGGQGENPSYFSATIDVLKFDSQNVKLKHEMKKTLVVPCSIPNITYTLDGNELHWVERIPLWATGGQQLRLPNWVSDETFAHMHTRIMTASKLQRSTGRPTNIEGELEPIFPYEFIP